MRVKPLLLIVVCALMLAGCAKTTTTTTNQPAPSTTAQTSTTTALPAASPQASGTAAATGAANGAPASPQPGADASTAAAPDPCRLLTSNEIKAVQGEEIKETKASQRSDASFAIGQCFYTTATFTKSISLEVTAQNPGSKTSPRAFWQENFARAAATGDHERDRDKDRDKKHKDEDKDKPRGEEEEEGAPPQRVAGLGDEAFWINTRVNGALYVLKGDRFIRLSLGGTDSNAARQRKAKTLAQKVLARLKQN